MDSSQPKMFVRDATGLVRSMGFLDQFLISQSIVSVVFGFTLTAELAPYFFPGAYLPLVFVIGVIPALGQAGVYAIMSRGMPRSGGDYVWSTRIFGPLYGMIQLVFIFALTIILGGIAIVSAMSIAIIPMLYALGIIGNNSGLFSLAGSLSTAPRGFIIDLVFLLILFITPLLGLRVYKWFLRVNFIFYYSVAALFIFLLLLVNPSMFPGTFNHAMSTVGSNATYAGVISQGAAGGVTSHINWTNTLLAAIPWGFIELTGFNYGTYLAGETKNTKNSFSRSLFLSLFVAIALWTLMSFLTYNAFGQAFFNSVDYVAATSPSLFPTAPTVTFLLSLTNSTLAVLLGMGLLIGITLGLTANFVSMSRMIFAASFDRLLPKSFANVNQRFGTPHWAVILVGGAYVIWVYVQWYFGYFASILNSSLVVPIGYILPMIATLVFYYRRRDLYKRTVGSESPLALIVSSIVGIIGLAFYAIAEVFPISSGLYLGASLTLAMEVVIALVILGGIIYGIARYRLSREKLDLRMIYTEIPPE